MGVPIFSLKCNVLFIMNPWCCLFPLFLLLVACQAPTRPLNDLSETQTKYTMKLSDSEWKKRLQPEAYEVLRNKATEAPFSGRYVNTTAEGSYVCAGCGTELFSSKDKFDAGCGWPSFSAALDNGRILEQEDLSKGRVRTEIICAHCGGHLGHVFNDGPAPTGLRYCVNSVSLDFEPKE